MKRFIKKVGFPILALFLFSALLIGSVSAAAIYSYDDRDPCFTYSARTATITSVGYNGTASRIARGNNCMFEFYGTELYIYAVTYTNSGRARIYVDGSPVGYTPSGVSSSYSQILAYSLTGLTEGKHTISIEAWDSTVTNPTGTSVTAYFFLDYIQTNRALDPEPFYQSLIVVILSIIAGLLLVFVVMRFAFWRLRND